METHPPKLIEAIVERLVPPACREHVLGDLSERYESPGQYMMDAVRTIPLVIASQVRRTSKIGVVVAEACAFACLLRCNMAIGSHARPQWGSLHRAPIELDFARSGCNLRAARALQQEVDALNSIEKKQ
jgi:hypothetical protein